MYSAKINVSLLWTSQFLWIMSYLIMRRGPEPGKIYPLEGGEVKIGRASKNDIIIHDNEVSRYHLELKSSIEGYELIDLTATRNTFVNGHRVEGIWLLQTECIIQIGDSITLEYHPGVVLDKLDTVETGDVRFRAAPVMPNAYMVVAVNTQSDATIYPLQGALIHVGRATSNDIVIVEAEMSRQHFSLTLTPEGYMITDHNSTNGTYVNGEKLEEPQLLHMDDVIQIGTTVQLKITNTPERYAAASSTERIVDAHPGDEDAIRKRKTSQAEIAGLIQNAPVPTDVGTGVDHVSLENQVLITYAREDWEQIVAPMIDKLYGAGIETWVDQYLIENSSDWLVAIEQARLECWLMVVVVSHAALQSELVRKNWRHFQNREKPIILFILEMVDRLPIGAQKLARIQYNPGIPDIGYQQLIAEIRRIREHKTPG
jgi:pSer/pThr/pTyr-binding forkhead associated (FHA) protein